MSSVGRSVRSGQRPAGDPIEEGMPGGDPELERRHADGRQRRVEVGDQRDVVEADDRDVLRHAQARPRAGRRSRRARRRRWPRTTASNVAAPRSPAIAVWPLRASNAACGDEVRRPSRSLPPQGRPVSLDDAPGRPCTPAARCVMQAIRRWPRPIRCSTAARAPATLSTSTLTSPRRRAARPAARSESRRAGAPERRIVDPRSGHDEAVRVLRAQQAFVRRRRTGQRLDHHPEARRARGAAPGRAASRRGRRRRRPARSTGAGRARSCGCVPPASWRAGAWGW